MLYADGRWERTTTDVIWHSAGPGPGQSDRNRETYIELATKEAQSSVVRALKWNDIRLHCRPLELEHPIHSLQSSAQPLRFPSYPVLSPIQYHTAIKMRFAVIALPVLAAGAAAQSS